MNIDPASTTKINKNEVTVVEIEDVTAPIPQEENKQFDPFATQEQKFPDMNNDKTDHQNTINEINAFRPPANDTFGNSDDGETKNVGLINVDENNEDEHQPFNLKGIETLIIIWFI